MRVGVLWLVKRSAKQPVAADQGGARPNKTSKLEFSTQDFSQDKRLVLGSNQGPNGGSGVLLGRV